MEPVRVRYPQTPKSFNASHGSWQAFETQKQWWQAVFRALLTGAHESTLTIRKPGCKHKTMDVPVWREGELEHGLAFVLVEGLMTFPTRNARDQGNFRVVIEKAIGDALQDGEWLDSDSWFPENRFEFGNLQARYEKGVSRTELMLFPS